MPETWEEAVLRIIRTRDAEISLQEIYQEMDSHPLVTPHHRELWEGQPNYYYWIRSSLARLKRRGDIQHVGHGLYNSTCDTPEQWEIGDLSFYINS